jgi:uncharacterized protein YbjT (DUF2867 family)
MLKIAIISGGSGLVGTQLLHQLFTQDQYDRVIAVGRRELALKHKKLVQVQVDFDRLTEVNLEEKLREKDLGGDNHSLITSLNNGNFVMHAYCSLGTTIKEAGSKENFRKIDHDYVLSFARWTRQLGATQFLYVSAIGADANSPIFYNKVKGEIERDLKPLSFKYIGIFQPSLLLGNRKETRVGEDLGKVVMKTMTFLGIYKKYKPIYDHQVAKAMLYHAGKNKTGIETISSKEMHDLKL